MQGRALEPPLKTDPFLEITHERKILFVASTGGHLAQLKRLSSRLRPTEDSLWVTFDSPQARSLLRNDNVFHVPYIRPRDWRATLGAARLVRNGIDSKSFDLVISTGAALAVAILPMLRLQGTPALYVESVSRTDGPSMTGRILAASRLVSLRTQHARWATRRWRPISPVLSSFKSIERTPPTRSRPRLFVTLGTIRPYRFDALVDSLLRTGVVDETTVWQVGETTRDDLPGEVHTYMPDELFRQSCAEADVVLTHAGVGTILSLLEMGVHPVVVPRRNARLEHVDNHQEQIAELVQLLNIAESVEADGKLDTAIQRAARRKVIDA